ncbi:hypothetical protein [Flagellimonas lutimaris]|uniref:hypothetical protein n=1 Tax=Flagellimonas lutimaris TaxID=475082 RepID=UPI003F5CD91A
MNKKNTTPNFLGYISLQSTLSLEELGEILSEKIFAGVKFGGKEKSIHEEIPAIFIEQPIMGLLVILDGYSGFEKGNWFTLHIQQWGEFGRYMYENKLLTSKVRLDFYLYYLMKQRLQEYSEIKIMEPEGS